MALPIPILMSIIIARQPGFIIRLKLFIIEPVCKPTLDFRNIFNGHVKTFSHFFHVILLFGYEKGVSATLQSGRYTFSYPRGRKAHIQDIRGVLMIVLYLSVLFSNEYGFVYHTNR